MAEPARDGQTFTVKSRDLSGEVIEVGAGLDETAATKVRDMVRADPFCQGAWLEPESAGVRT